MINPKEVEVDRSWEKDTIRELDEAIEKPWEKYETLRIVTIGCPLGAAEYITRMYVAAGWRLHARPSRTKDSTKFIDFEFGRPGDRRMGKGETR